MPLRARRDLGDRNEDPVVQRAADPADLLVAQTDKRDAYWIGKLLVSQMMPHPVYVPGAQIGTLRGLLSQRRSLVQERKRWLLRARSHLRAAGLKLPSESRTVARLRASVMSGSDGVDEHLAVALDVCQRQEEQLSKELASIEARLQRETKDVAEVQRLRTIPAVGD